MNSASPSRRTSADGFTLPEMMMTGAIGTLILGAVISSYLVSVKSFYAVGNYTEIHRDGREAVNYFAKDMRAVSLINSYNASNITVTIPTAFNNSGIAISNKTVQYTYQRGALYRYDSSLGYNQMLATNIYFLSYSLYDRIGSNTTLTSVAKSIAVEIRLRKYTISQIQSEDYISARLDMRNKL